MKTLTRARPLLGTLVQIWGTHEDSSLILSAIDTAFAQIAQVESLMNYHSAHSHLTALNRAPLETPIALDPMMREILEHVDYLYRLSGGIFDISVAGYLACMGMDSEILDLPAPDPHGCWKDAHLLDGMLTLSKRLRLDLSGIAKGYAVDRAYDSLYAQGIRSFGINAGGEIRWCSPSPTPILIRHPLSPTQIAHTLELSSCAIATSANSYRDSNLFPLIDPQTHCAPSATRSISIIAPTCTLADALTKIVAHDPTSYVLAHYGAEAIILESIPEPSMS